MQEEIRQKQKAAKEKKNVQGDGVRSKSSGRQVPSASLLSDKAADSKPEAALPLASASSSSFSPGSDSFPSMITEAQYFAACPYSFFSHRSLTASEESVDTLMTQVKEKRVVGYAGENPVTMAEFHYFSFQGTDEEKWSPRLYAKLAWEGFFTITQGARSGRHHTPLPELQPFYSVVEWRNFHSCKHVKKGLRRLRSSSGVGRLELRCTTDVDSVWRGVTQYHEDLHGVNWLSKRYLETMTKASADPELNFRAHAIALYVLPPETGGGDGKGGEEGLGGSGGGSESEVVDREPRLIAGEIGYSIGPVYTSLSGFSERLEREGMHGGEEDWVDEDEGGTGKVMEDAREVTAKTASSVDSDVLDLGGVGAGTAQLLLLGLWLEERGFSFWSLGHCYSPAMDYKRRLGHRVLPREAFLERLQEVRGPFIRPPSGDLGGRSLEVGGGGESGGSKSKGFQPFAGDDSVAAKKLLRIQT
uniref:Uncharacterized protein n=1 Tax=Chromera velia CCMP2878 TaxID=1169474 RepID=A0A0G4FBI0_9ALVE|eukprot:Cvel_16162.t1-p1 / transcript=Cvel_16162.t1 / gene=Cvel_16162 / organism=Chromera_velia_CCMP2878 / gene_product=hypothetical protein / transcript_product=hypothetical protein / location=Cvel_scaffold1231:50202-51617(+) / protein_length=472 / sequence_SO=supercontig / SO=protein_coding / is_pseudo=false